MKKGMVLEQVGYAILALVVIVIVATIFYSGGQKIWAIVETAFFREQLCQGKTLSSYKSELAQLQEVLEREQKDSAKYRDASERFGKLNEEYQKCGFQEKIQLTPSGKLSMARYYAAKGNNQEAIALYEEYVSQAGASAGVLNELYGLYKDEEKALVILRRIVAENPGTKEAESAQYEIAAHYEKKKEFAKAKEEYQKLLSSKYFAKQAADSIAKIERIPPPGEKSSPTEKSQ